MSFLFFIPWAVTCGVFSLMTSDVMVPKPVTSDVTAEIRSEEEPTSEGIRFVLLDTMPNKTVYMAMDGKTVKKMDLRMGLPGGRMLYPENGKLVFYRTPPVAGEELDVMLSTDLPADKGNKLVGIVRPLGKGLHITFVEDKDLKPGMVLMKNMTGTDYKLELANVPDGEKNEVILKPGDEHLFGAGYFSGRSSTHGVTMKHMVSLGGNAPEWYVNRKFMITRYSNRAVMRLLVPYPDGTIIIHDIYIFPDEHR